MEVEKIIYKAKDGRLFNDPLECEDYEKSLGVLPNSIGDLINQLEKEHVKGDYMTGIIIVKESNGQTSIYAESTVNIDDKLEDYVNVENLKEEQRYLTAKVDDVVKFLKKLDKDRPCQYMIVYSKNIDFQRLGVMANHNKEVWK